jgi:hypothetical protein
LWFHFISFVFFVVVVLLLPSELFVEVRIFKSLLVRFCSDLGSFGDILAKEATPSLDNRKDMDYCRLQSVDYHSSQPQTEEKKNNIIMT